MNCDEAGLQTASEIVMNGGIIVYPTDTVYGIGCDPTRESAVRRILDLKGRSSKPMPILCSDMESARKMIGLGNIGSRLAKKFWPGALTIIAEIKHPTLPIDLTGGSRKLGVRIPDHTCARRLIDLCGGDLVGTSANRSGVTPPARAEDVPERLGAGFDVLVDSGPTPLAMESTVVDVTSRPISILREGAISKEEVFATLGI